MFISLLNLGIATAVLLLAFMWPLLRGLSYIGISWFGKPIPINVGVVICMFFVSLPFLERRRYFYRMAMELPFSVAAFKLEETETKGPPLESLQRVPTVYLAGGFHSGWQDRLMNNVDFLHFSDPRVHGLENKIQYTMWDLEAVRRSDWVFAYIEATNPGLYSLAVEVGYAKALGKYILLVDEKSSSDLETERYLGMIQSVADIVFESFDEALGYMKSLESIYRAMVH